MPGGGGGGGGAGGSPKRGRRIPACAPYLSLKVSLLNQASTQDSKP